MNQIVALIGFVYCCKFVNFAHEIYLSLLPIGQDWLWVFGHTLEQCGKHKKCQINFAFFLFYPQPCENLNSALAGMLESFLSKEILSYEENAMVLNTF